MKLYLKITTLLILLIPCHGLFAQSATDGKYEKATKDGIGILPGIELASTPRNQSDVVFAPDITYSFDDNQIGFGPRLILNNTNSVSNASIATTENSFGVGANYRKFLSSTKKMFEWFVYYDMEYYNYNSSAPFAYYNYPQLPPNSGNVETYKTNNFNFVTGFGYHLNLNTHFYMTTLLGIGIGLEYGKHAYPGADVNNNPITVTDTYSTKSLVGQFKLGIGYVF